MKPILGNITDKNGLRNHDTGRNSEMQVIT